MNQGNSPIPRNVNAMANTNDAPSGSYHGLPFGAPSQNVGQGIDTEADSAAKFYHTGFTPTGIDIMPSVLPALHPITNPLGVRSTGPSSWASPSGHIVAQPNLLGAHATTDYGRRAAKIEALAQQSANFIAIARVIRSTYATIVEAVPGMIAQPQVAHLPDFDGHVYPGQNKAVQSQATKFESQAFSTGSGWRLYATPASSPMLANLPYSVLANLPDRAIWRENDAEAERGRRVLASLYCRYSLLFIAKERYNLKHVPGWMSDELKASTEELAGQYGNTRKVVRTQFENARLKWLSMQRQHARDTGHLRVVEPFTTHPWTPTPTSLASTGPAPDPGMLHGPVPGTSGPVRMGSYPHPGPAGLTTVALPLLARDAFTAADLLPNFLSACERLLYFAGELYGRNLLLVHEEFSIELISGFATGLLAQEVSQQDLQQRIERARASSGSRNIPLHPRLSLHPNATAEAWAKHRDTDPACVASYAALRAFYHMVAAVFAWSHNHDPDAIRMSIIPFVPRTHASDASFHERMEIHLALEEGPSLDPRAATEALQVVLRMLVNSAQGDLKEAIDYTRRLRLLCQ